MLGTCQQNVGMNISLEIDLWRILNTTQVFLDSARERGGREQLHNNSKYKWHRHIAIIVNCTFQVLYINNICNHFYVHKWSRLKCLIIRISSVRTSLICTVSIERERKHKDTRELFLAIKNCFLPVGLSNFRLMENKMFFE